MKSPKWRPGYCNSIPFQGSFIISPPQRKFPLEAGVNILGMSLWLSLLLFNTCSLLIQGTSTTASPYIRVIYHISYILLSKLLFKSNREVQLTPVKLASYHSSLRVVDIINKHTARINLYSSRDNDKVSSNGPLSLQLIVQQKVLLKEIIIGAHIDITCCLSRRNKLLISIWFTTLEIQCIFSSVLLLEFLTLT